MNVGISLQLAKRNMKEKLWFIYPFTTNSQDYEFFKF